MNTSPPRDFDTSQLQAFVAGDWLDPADVELEAPQGLVPTEPATLPWLPTSDRGPRG